MRRVRLAPFKMAVFGVPLHIARNDTNKHQLGDDPNQEHAQELFGAHLATIFGLMRFHPALLHLGQIRGVCSVVASQTYPHFSRSHVHSNTFLDFVLTAIQPPVIQGTPGRSTCQVRLQEKSKFGKTTAPPSHPIV